MSGVGGTGVDSISEFQPDAYPHRLEAGTGSIPGIAGLNAAQKWFADLGRAQPGAASDADHATACGHALAHIESVEVSHIRHIHNALDAMDGVTVYGPRGNRPRVATLSFNIESLPAPQVGEMLDADHHVCVRAGLHCAPLVHEDCGTSEDSSARCGSPPATSPTTRIWGTAARGDCGARAREPRRSDSSSTRGENPAGRRLRPQIGEVPRPVEAVALKGRRSVSGGRPRPRA